MTSSRYEGVDPRTFDPVEDLNRASGVVRVLDAFNPDRCVNGASGSRAASEGMRVFEVPGV